MRLYFKKPDPAFAVLELIEECCQFYRSVDRSRKPLVLVCEQEGHEDELLGVLIPHKGDGDEPVKSVMYTFHVFQSRIVGLVEPVGLRDGEAAWDKPRFLDDAARELLNAVCVRSESFADRTEVIVQNSRKAIGVLRTAVVQSDAVAEAAKRSGAEDFVHVFSGWQDALFGVKRGEREEVEL